MLCSIILYNIVYHSAAQAREDVSRPTVRLHDQTCVSARKSRPWSEQWQATNDFKVGVRLINECATPCDSSSAIVCILLNVTFLSR